METVKYVLAHAQWLIDKGRGDEPAKIFLPRIEAQRKKANREKKTRVQFETDEQTYSDFHEQKNRYVELCFGNPTLAYPIMVQILAAVDGNTIHRMAEADSAVIDASNPSLGDS